jgi:formate dehydrogenase subunit beta
MLGLNCGGTMRPVTMMATAKAYGLDPDSVVSEEISKGKLILRTEDGEKAITMDELEEEGYGRRDACKSCSINIPKMADLACGNWGVPKERTGGATFVEVLTEKGKRIFINAVDAGYVEFEEASEKSVNIREKIDETMRELADEWYKRLSHGIDEFSREGRLSFYIETFSDCIECGSCRIVCPVCSCGEDSKCLGMNDERDAYKISAFHLIRLLHLMDSCIGCGQCEEVCPVDIPLTTVHRRFAERMQKKLDYTPGMDLRRPPFFETGLLEI